MKQKRKSTTLFIVLLAVLLVVVLGAGFLIYMDRQTIKDYKAQVEDLEWEIDLNTAVLYVTTKYLPKGTVLEEGVNVELQENVTGLPEEFYIQAEDMGKTLVVDVEAYSPIMASMVTEEKITNDTREYEVGVAALMIDQQVNDYVDIRIMFPNGEDYIVCSKVKVKKLLLDSSIFYTNLNESEILTLASATIDAYTITGTKIYTTRYVEGNLQEEAIPNYPVRGDILSLIASDPNVLEVAQQTLNYNARTIMEAKLAALTEDQLKSVREGHGIADTSRNAALVTVQQEQSDMVTESEVLDE